MAITKRLPRLNGMKMKCLSLAVLVIVIMALLSTFSPSLFLASSQMSQELLEKVDSGEDVETLDLGAKASVPKSGMQLGDEIKLEDTSGMDVEERLDKMNLMLQVVSTQLLNSTREQKGIREKQAKFASTLNEMGRLLKRTIVKEKDLENFANKVKKMEGQLTKIVENTRYAIAAANCEQYGGTVFAGKCYVTHWADCYSKSYEVAKNICKSKKQSLVYPENLGELHFLSEYLWSFPDCPHIGFERLNVTDGFISADGYITINSDSNLWETMHNGLGELSNKYACLAMNTSRKKLVVKPDSLRNFACFYKMWY